MPPAERDASPAAAWAQRLFLRDDNYYGCSESTMLALKHAYELPNPDDSSVAMAFNGGIAYSGGMCGAITGAAIAVGELASRHIDDHILAKRTARAAIQELISEFTGEFGSIGCGTLTGYDLLTQHEEFIESGFWRTTCMRQIEFAVGHLEHLADRWSEGSESV